MESNGKQVNTEGRLVGQATGPIIWGGVGTNGQHAFHQHLMQSTQLTPCDFIVAINSHNPIAEHQKQLYANCLAQSQALMFGKTEQEAEQALIAAGMAVSEAQSLAPHKVIPGNRPSNTLVIEKLTPYQLGSLIAMYEHVVFCQAAIWDINAFDQWGVELGKTIANDIADSLETGDIAANTDSSTAGLSKLFI